MQKTIFDYITKTAGASAIDDERARLADVYKRNGKAHSTEAEVDADILANFVGTKLLTDENAIRYVVGYKRSFGVWMREQITRLKAALGSKNAKVQAFLDKAARLYHDALVESKNTGRDPEKNKYSISRTRRMNWREQVEGYFRQNGSIKSSDSLYLGTSESTLSEKGIPDAPLYVPTSIINKATRKPKGSKSGHSLTQNDILSLAEGIKNAPIIIHNPARNALIYVTSNQNASGQNIVAIFDLNNDLHGENAHRATSIHGRDSVAAMLKNLGSDSTVFITNENGFNDIAGLQSNITSELLAKVESIENSISEVGENVNSSSKKSFSVSEADEFDESIMDTDVNAETLRELKQEAERKASSEYDKLLQEEYNKRQVLYNPDEGKSVKREDLKLVDKKYLERTERQLMNRLAQRMD